MTTEGEKVAAIEKSKSTDMAAKYNKIMADTGWVPGMGFVNQQQKGSSTNSELNSRDNANERIEDTKRGQFETAATAGVAGGAALIKQAQSSDNSGTGGQNSGNNNDQAQRDVKNISAIALAKEASGLRAPVQISFDMDPEERELKVAQNRLIDQTLQRFGIDLKREDIAGMDVNDIQGAIKALATRTKADVTPKASVFLDKMIQTTDFFDPIA